MAWCPLCEKKFQDRRGLHGHFRFVHGIEYGSGKPAKRTVLTEAVGKSIKRSIEGRRLVKNMEEEEKEAKFRNPTIEDRTSRVEFRNDIGGEKNKNGYGERRGVIFRNR